MQIFYPHSEIVYRPSPAFFLGPFNIYDREESLGVVLDGFDPNDPCDLCELFDRFFFPRWEAGGGYTTNHKIALVDVLLVSLRNPNYDFEVLLQDGDEECFYLPGNWNIRSARQFFLGAYESSVRHWERELRDNNFALPAVAELRPMS